MNINTKIVHMSAAFVSPILKEKLKILRKFFWKDCGRRMAEIIHAIINHVKVIHTNVLWSKWIRLKHYPNLSSEKIQTVWKFWNHSHGKEILDLFMKKCALIRLITRNYIGRMTLNATVIKSLDRFDSHHQSVSLNHLVILMKSYVS